MIASYLTKLLLSRKIAIDQSIDQKRKFCDSDEWHACIDRVFRMPSSMVWNGTGDELASYMRALREFDGIDRGFWVV